MAQVTITWDPVPSSTFLQQEISGVFTTITSQVAGVGTALVILPDPGNYNFRVAARSANGTVASATLVVSILANLPVVQPQNLAAAIVY